MLKKALLLLGLVLSAFVATTSTQAAAPPPTCFPCPGGR